MSANNIAMISFIWACAVEEIISDVYIYYRYTVLNGRHSDAMFLGINLLSHYGVTRSSNGQAICRASDHTFLIRCDYESVVEDINAYNRVIAQFNLAA